MKVDISNVSSFQRKLDFVVPAADVKKQLDDAFRKLACQVRMAGFRKGKAPRRVLEGRFGPKVRMDVADQLIQRSYVTAITENELQPVGQPSLAESKEIKGGTDFEFSITVDVRPEVALDNITGIEVVFPKYEVKDDEIDAAVKARLEGNARLVEVTDRGVEIGDMVLCELTVTDGDDEVAREIGTMIRTEADPYYPGVEAFLAGMKADEEKSGKVTFGEDARTEEVAGRELDVAAKVISIQTNQVPELTTEIAEELGFEGGIEGMRNALSAQLAAGREEMARNQARANLLEKLIELNPFDVPEGMVESSLKMLVEELKMQQAWRTGQDPKKIHFPEAQLADLRQRAAFASKAGLILEFVSKTENIDVTDADLDAKYAELAEARGQTVEAVKGWFVKDGATDELKDRILEEKTLEWLLERAVLVDPPAVEEAAEEAAPAKKAAPKKKAAAKKAAPKKKAAAKKEAAPAASSDVDLSVLNQAIGKLKTALASGDHDANIDALIDAETAGKARKGALDALKARK